MNPSIFVNAKIERKEGSTEAEFMELMECLELLDCRWRSEHKPTELADFMHFARYIYIEKGVIACGGNIKGHIEESTKDFWRSPLPLIKPEDMIDGNT